MLPPPTVVYLVGPATGDAEGKTNVPEGEARLVHTDSGSLTVPLPPGQAHPLRRPNDRVPHALSLHLGRPSVQGLDKGRDGVYSGCNEAWKGD